MQWGNLLNRLNLHKYQILSERYILHLSEFMQKGEKETSGGYKEGTRTRNVWWRSRRKVDQLSPGYLPTFCLPDTNYGKVRENSSIHF